MIKVFKTKNIFPPRKNLKRKISFGIISILALGIFLLPISPSFELKKGGEVAVGVKINEAKAVLDKVEAVIDVSVTDTSFTADITINGITDEELDNYYLTITAFPTVGFGQDPVEDAEAVFDDQVEIDTSKPSQKITRTVHDLTPPGSSFLIYAFLHKNKYDNWYDIHPYVRAFKYFFTSTPPTLKAEKPILLSTNNVGGNVGDTTITKSAYDLGCNLISGFLPGLMGCINGVFYTIWEVSASIAHLSGKFLDFFIYYSTDSESYKSDFVKKGWAAIRDVANIFFIIALLYIAIKTILGLNVSNNKKMIGTVVIVALIINFSLFFTQVIIDGSNILGKIFYNNITSKDSSGNVLPPGAGGEKSISLGLVDKFNPQDIVSEKAYPESQGLFWFITILAITITLYTAYIFFSVALLFLARVVSLWISMIFAPIAFASYTLPFDIPGLGHKEWWSELLKNAFLAPIFIFFLYIIVMFTGFLTEIVGDYQDSTDKMQHLMHVIIPFAILTALLMKAKKLAITYSGEMGKAVMSAGKMIGGVALGAAAGGAALGLRKSFGWAGNKLANSSYVKTSGRFGRGLQNFGNVLGKGSFDIRGVKIAGKDLSSTGLTGLGKAQEGGYAKMRADKVKRRQKRANELEVGEDEELTQDLHRLENELQELRAVGTHEITEIDRRIDGAIKADKAAQAALNAARGTAGEQVARNAAITTANRVNDLRQQRSNIKNASGTQQNIQNINNEIANRQAYLATTQQIGTQAEIAQAQENLHATQVALAVAQRANGRSMNNYEDTLIPQAENARQNESRRRKRNYAFEITHGISGSIGGNTHREAGHKILMDSKIEEKSTGGEHH